MASPAIYSKTQLKVKIGATYTLIDGITNIGGPAFSKPAIDITDMNSTAKEFKAAALAAMRVPATNSSWQGEFIREYKSVDMSVAVQTPIGLLTPIVKSANSKGLEHISLEMKDLGARAKEGKLQPHEFIGGTFTISNMGMFGIKQFEAVINPPQGMIMAIGAGEKRPYIIDDTLGVATVMSATGSFDHRAIDGADGAQLMQAFKTLVEAPLSMLA